MNQRCGLAASVDLTIPAVDQDIVPEHVFTAVMLVIAARGRVVDHVALQADARRAFVVVQSPTPRARGIVGIDIVDQVVADACPRGNPQGITPPISLSTPRPIWCR